MTENRRLAAIMAVDVVGYSRLMGEDEAGTARAVREHREAAQPLVADKGGRIVKTMGDGLLLEFPSVVAAVECAVAIQQLMVERNAQAPEARRIVYRIGVNLGDVLIEGDDILGDGVNIAARLEGICEPGGVLLSSAAYDQTRGKIDAAFVDLGEKTLKNIARPVRVFAVKTGAAPATSSPGRQGPPRLSMVVLPFANLGGGEEHEYFVDGVTESLTTDLSRIRGSFVIGRNTAFTYKGKAVDLKQIGRELSVRYVLEGSVQRGGNRMRVNVQLIDSDSGHHLWAERFDKPLADLFDMQDEIVARLAGALNTQLVEAEARRAERIANPDALDLYFQGLAWFNKGASPSNVAKALGIYEQALTIDPDNVDVFVGLGYLHTVAAAASFGVDVITAFATAEANLTKALTLSPNHARGHMYLGFLYILTKRAAQGVEECNRALKLDRNLASAYAYAGLGKAFSGCAEETESHIAEALRLSPFDTMAYTWLTFVGASKMQPGSSEQAIPWFRRSIEINRNYPGVNFWLAAALAHSGKYDEARLAIEDGLAINPSFSISLFRAVYAAASDDEKYLITVNYIVEGLRRAGLREQ